MAPRTKRLDAKSLHLYLSILVRQSLKHIVRKSIHNDDGGWTSGEKIRGASQGLLPGKQPQLFLMVIRHL